jgi:hypothetical protein
MGDLTQRTMSGKFTSSAGLELNLWLKVIAVGDANRSSTPLSTYSPYFSLLFSPQRRGRYLVSLSSGSTLES